jgi:hypothetical protein
MAMNVSKRLFEFFAVALVVGSLIGCGGDGSNPSGGNDGVPISGGLPQTQSTATATIPASATEQTITLTNGQTAVVPATATPIPTTAPLAVFPRNVPIISNMTLGTALTRAPGDITVNGTVLSGVTVGTNGQLTANLALPPGIYFLEAEGPFTLNAAGSQLTVGRYRFKIEVDSDGFSSMPKSIAGTLPPNGGNTRNGYLDFFVQEAFSGRRFSLTLFKENGDLGKTTVLNNDLGIFQDLATNGNPIIPSRGIDIVQFNILSD